MFGQDLETIRTGHLAPLKRKLPQADFWPPTSGWRVIWDPDLTTTVLALTITRVAADSVVTGGNNPRRQRRLAAIVAMLVGAVAGGRIVNGSIWLPLAVCGAGTAGCAFAHMHLNSKRR